MNFNKKLYFKVLGLCFYVFLGVLVFFMIIPFLWMISVSLKSSGHVTQTLSALIPRNITFKPYVDAWVGAHFSRYFLNTVIFTVGSTMFTLFFCALGGYTFARLRFPGRNALFLLILFSMMIPDSARLIPQFLIVKFFPLAGGNNLLGRGGIGLIDTYAGLILPFAVTGFGVFLCRQFFVRLPEELRAAAKIDGCSEFRIFYQIMLPLAKPAIIALAIFTFTFRWNKLLWPLVVTQSKGMRVLAVGLAIFQGEQRTLESWNTMMAAATIVVIPMVLVFLLLQKHFTKGTSLSGLKE